jgi:hypothetical protein
MLGVGKGPDSELTRLVEAWPRLPDAVRKGLLTMVDVVLHGAAPECTPPEQRTTRFASYRTTKSTPGNL